MLKSIITAFVALFLLSSCTKEQVLMSEALNENPSNGAQKIAGGNDLQWNMDTSGGGNHSCPPDGKKCSAISVLPVHENESFKKAFEAIKGGEINLIIATFEENKAVLEKYLPASLIERVIHHEIVPRAMLNPSNNKSFMVFGAEPDVLVYEYTVR